MATQDVSNDYFFDGFIEDLVNRDIELGDDNQSDLSISSIHQSIQVTYPTSNTQRFLRMTNHPRNE